MAEPRTFVSSFPHRTHKSHEQQGHTVSGNICLIKSGQVLVRISGDAEPQTLSHRPAAEHLKCLEPQASNRIRAFSFINSGHIEVRTACDDGLHDFNAHVEPSRVSSNGSMFSFNRARYSESTPC